MKKLKFSKRTKNIGILTVVFAGATAINVVKDQAAEISSLNNTIQNLSENLFNDIDYELNLESFIVNQCGEEVLQLLNK